MQNWTPVILEMTGMIIILIPFVCLCVGPFWKQMRSNSKGRCWVLASCLVVGAMATVWARRELYLGRVNFLWLEGYLLLSVVCIGYLSKTAPHKMIYCSFLGVNCSTFLAVSAILLKYCYFPEQDGGIIPLQLIPYFLIASSVLAYFCNRLFQKQVKPLLYDQTNVTKIHNIWLPYAVCLCIMLLLFMDLDTRHPVVQISVYLLCLICTGLCYALNGRLFVAAKQNAILGERDATLEHLLEIQEKQYAALFSHIEEIRIARHDLRHHIRTIRQYIFDGDQDKLKEYLDTYVQQMPQKIPLTICENTAVNAIARHYLELAQQENVQLDVVLNLEENPGISASDLCIVLGNSLENALEAARDVEEHARFIRVRSLSTPAMLAVVISNSFSGTLTASENGTFLSTKHPGRQGIGLFSMRVIAEKYDGYAKFEVQDQVFETSIILYKQEAW